MSDTPRTDAMAVNQECCGGEYRAEVEHAPDGDYVLADDARQLERELSAAIARAEAAEADLLEMEGERDEAETAAQQW